MKKSLKIDKITKEITFEELTLKYPKTISFLLEKGLHCVGCHAAPIETLEQGALVHWINPDKLVKELNLLVLKEAKRNG